MKKMKKIDLLWIFALKDNMAEQFYNEYYGPYDDEPKTSTLYTIISNVIDRLDVWKDVMWLLRNNLLTKRVMVTLNEKEYKEPTFEEWLNYGFKIWAIHVTRDDLNKWWGNKTWELIVNDQRRKWNAITK